MKATKISYGRVFSMDGYENKKVFIEVELEGNDTTEAAYQFAVDFVESKNPAIIKKQNESIQKEEYDKLKDEYQSIVNVPENYSEEQSIEAIIFIRNDRSENLPF